MEQSRIIRLPISVYIRDRKLRKQHEENGNYLINESFSSIPNLFSVLSLNYLIGKDDNNEFLDIIATDEDTPEELVTKKELTEQMHTLLEKCHLKPRDKDMLMLFLGESTKNSIKLANVMEKYHISKERASQIIKRILKTIINSKYVDKLSSYMEDSEYAISQLNNYRKKYLDNKKYAVNLNDFFTINKKNKTVTDGETSDDVKGLVEHQNKLESLSNNNNEDEFLNVNSSTTNKIRKDSLVLCRKK